MLSNFNYSFTAAFSDELQIKLEQNLLHHLKSVATLPCKNVCPTVQLYSALFNANVMENR